MRLFGLIGYPLSHSFSRDYFTEKFEREGWNDCRYELFPLDSIDKLPSLLNEQTSLQGLNVTIPYKKSVLPYLDSTRHLPEGNNACNCIRTRDGFLEGFNTDVTGFEKSIQPFLKEQHGKALVLGNGGAAAAVVWVLKKLGIGIEIVSRQIHNGSTLTYQQVDRSIIEDHKIIINTTPLGLYPALETYPDIPYDHITKDHLLYDLIYNPSETVFLAKGKMRGAVIKNGKKC
jgi:shikimate dehydrogenase